VKPTLVELLTLTDLGYFGLVPLIHKILVDYKKLITQHLPPEAVRVSEVKYIEFSRFAYLEMKIYCGQTS
jgi:hypothetical protein